MGNLKQNKNNYKMKFAALIATTLAFKTPDLPKMSLAQKFGKKGISLAQMGNAVSQDYTVEEVFHWFDRDDSGAVDIYEFIFGIGWICGYYEYEPTEEDAMALYEFWIACDADANGELTLDEVYAYEETYGFE